MGLMMRSKLLMHQKIPVPLLLSLCIACLLFLHCDGSSRMHVHQVAYRHLRPRFHPHHRYNPSEVMWFLPRGIPTPNSAPSRKHNSIGVQSWRPSRISSSAALGSP